MAKVSIRHRTTYRYRNPVAFGEHRMMLRPLEAFDQTVCAFEVEVSPEPSLLRHIHDINGANVSVARFDKRADRLAVEARVGVDHQPETTLDLEAEDARLSGASFAYEPADARELSRFVARSSRAGEVDAWARRFLRPVGQTRLSTVLTDMTHAIREEMTYGVRLEGQAQSPIETLERRGGSCRDFAVLMMDGARSLGLAAQFVSGYVYSGSPKAGLTGGGHTHAWARVYVPGCGWADFDPTNGIVGAGELIRVASVADPRHAIPLYGTWAGLPSDFLGMDVEVDVTADAGAMMQPDRPLRVAQGG